MVTTTTLDRFSADVATLAESTSKIRGVSDLATEAAGLAGCFSAYPKIARFRVNVVRRIRSPLPNI